MPDNEKFKAEGEGGITPPDPSMMKPEEMPNIPFDKEGFWKLKKEYDDSVKDFEKSEKITKEDFEKRQEEINETKENFVSKHLKETGFLDEVDEVLKGARVEKVLANADSKIAAAYDNATSVMDRVFNSVSKLNYELSSSLDAFDINLENTMAKKKSKDTTKVDEPSKPNKTKIELLIDFITKVDVSKIEHAETAHQVQQIMLLSTEIARDFQVQTSYERLYDRVLEQTTRQQKEIKDNYYDLLNYREKNYELLRRRQEALLDRTESD
jgi:hypothetical protein